MAEDLIEDEVQTRLAALEGRADLEPAFSQLTEQLHRLQEQVGALAAGQEMLQRQVASWERTAQVGVDTRAAIAAQVGALGEGLRATQERVSELGKHLGGGQVRDNVTVNRVTALEQRLGDLCGEVAQINRRYVADETGDHGITGRVEALEVAVRGLSDALLNDRNRTDKHEARLDRLESLRCWVPTGGAGDRVIAEQVGQLAGLVDAHDKCLGQLPTLWGRMGLLLDRVEALERRVTMSPPRRGPYTAEALEEICRRGRERQAAGADPIALSLQGIQEQVDQGHYLDALARLTELQQELIQRFSQVEKREP